MTDQAPELPSSGYSLLRVYTTRLEANYAEPAKSPDPSGTTVNFGFEWRPFVGGRFDIKLRLSVNPSTERSEALTVHLVGQFKEVGNPTVPVEEFAKLQGVAILFPYLRQHLTMVTLSSFNGPFFLPSVNVGTLMQSPNDKKSKKIATPRRAKSRAVSAKKR